MEDVVAVVRSQIEKQANQKEKQANQKEKQTGLSRVLMSKQ
jgi:hypothetical protein